MTKSLPPEPSLKFLKLEAKSILKAHRKKAPPACDVLRNLHKFADLSEKEILAIPVNLQEVQYALAMEYGFKTWKELKDNVTKEEKKMVKFGNLKQELYNTTLMSVVKGVADYFENPLSPAMLYGMSGHAFVINIHKSICPSSPYAWEHDRFFQLLKNVGIATEHLGFFTEQNSAEGREALEAKLRGELEEKLKKALDEKQPCSFCNMEHQIINGYDSKGLIFTLPWPNCEIGEDITPSRLDFGTWKQFKEVHACFFVHSKVEPVDEMQALRECLQYAVDIFTKSSELSMGDYGMGTEAYKNWIAAAEKFGGEHGNWWNSMVWSECRKMASEFFKELGAKYSQIADECNKLVTLYNDISVKLYETGDKEKTFEDKVILLQGAEKQELEAVEVIKQILSKLSV